MFGNCFCFCAWQLIIYFIIFLLVPPTPVHSFVCEEECGLYGKGDEMKDMQKDCKGLHDPNSCSNDYNLEKPELKPRIDKVSANKQRVLDGHDLKHPLPWMVLIKIPNEKGESSSICGGSLINSRFILTAAHCFCDTSDYYCSRRMADLNKDPITTKVEALKNLNVFIGATDKYPDGNKAWSEQQLEDFKDAEEKGILYKVDKAWIHPKLATEMKFEIWPDIALLRLEKPVKAFNKAVRPICLNKEEKKDVPACADKSVDSVAGNVTKGVIEGKHKGGCGIIAGWGYKFAEKYTTGRDCSTQATMEFPSRSMRCSKKKWQYRNDDENFICNKEDPFPTNFFEACKDLIQEMNFQKNKKEIGEGKWEYGNFTELANNAPIRLQLKKKGGKKVNITCSTTDMSNIKHKWLINNPQRKESDFPGWCATKVKNDGTIKEMGLCSNDCRDMSQTIQFATLNLLTKDECAEINPQDENKDPTFSDEYEMCAGKKHMFPPKIYLFQRAKKNKEVRVKDKEIMKKIIEKYGEEDAEKFYKPSKYGLRIVKELGEKDDGIYEGVHVGYPYNWYIGSADTCQGDSGGPLWTNVEAKDGIRATQIGVVSRGKDCGVFQKPGIYTRVSKIYDWLKQTIEENKEDTEMCPSSK